MLRKGIAGLAVAVGMSLGPAGAHAADFTVDSLLDTPPDAPATANGCEALGGDECTLREAVAASNADCAATGTDRILFASSLAGGTVQRTQNDPIAIQGKVEVVGPGASQLTLSGADTDDVVNRPILTLDWFCQPLEPRTFRGLTFTDGAPAIRAELANDTMVVEDSTFTENAFTGGGAIHNPAGFLTVRRSVFTGNTSEGDAGGGAIVSGTLGFGGWGATATIEDSTFAGNMNSSGGGGGAISSNASRLTIRRSTFHQNTGAAGALAGGGGAIRILSDNAGAVPSQKQTTIVDSTITENHEFAGIGGGGIRVVPAGLGTGLTLTSEPGPVSITGTIVADNTREASPDVPDDIQAPAGVIDEFAYSLILDSAGANLPADDLATDIIGQDPGLGLLQANGGPTPTRAPLTSASPVVDSGSSDSAADQRGAPRPVDWPAEPNVAGGDASDIGSVELQVPPVQPPDPPPDGDKGGGPPTKPKSTKPKCKKRKKKGSKKRRSCKRKKAKKKR